MADNDEEKNEAVVESTEEIETSEDSSPQSEQETTEPETTQEAELDAHEDTEEASEMTEEQRKSFQRMRLENKKLKEEIQARQKGESAFDVFRPKAPTGGVDINNYVDPNTGNVDWGSYNNAVVQSAQAAASQTVSEQLDEQTARQKYPEVFENPDLEEAIAGRWLAAKLQGKDVSITELADKFSGLVQKEVDKAERKAEKRGAEQALNELTPKEAAALKAQGTTSAPARQAQSAEDEESLKVAARYGNEDALAALVGGVGWKK